ncbi:MAG: hypothetical protein C5B51_22390 [Terriglobia bacterium]|nr:MAG: hypothetical protein C5B51_22390 [Terriglobia bacterium]
MTTKRWRRIEELFLAAGELPRAEQENYVRGATASDPEMQRQLLAMLKHAGSAPDRIARAIESVAEAVVPVDSWHGRRFGPYRIVREIGRGGMGLVFEASRDDDEYFKRVALKVAPDWRDIASLRERFRHERQILAQLEHHNIARFLDGGTQNGIPYFAMEYVEGVPITGYCAALPIRDRLELFCQVCAAVHYAHQSLVVHRDLKPANILVNEEGVPKLLDFGIAKLLTPDLDSGSTMTGMMLWTPDYASPEQVRGRPVTTRTDVYSLGLILYELLSGKRAQQADTSSALALDRSICESEPPAAGLDRDLESIVRMAIRKEPEKRYGSAADLGADLRRYLERKPVRARAGNWAYKAGKSVRRHRFGVAAGALVAASLIAGVISTIHQARRAERRFEQVRKLANTFVFDVHDSVAFLPGSTAARKIIVQTALTYLENLRDDAAGDAALERELAAAYERIGNVQGAPASSNLGDSKGALASYQRAEGLLTPLVQVGDRAARRQLASVDSRLGTLHMAMGETKPALESYGRAQSLLRGLLEESPRDRVLLDLSGENYSETTRALFTLGDFRAAGEAARASMELARRLSQMNPSDPVNRNRLSVAFSNMGRAQLGEGKIEEAAKSFGEAVKLRESLSRDEPNNKEYRRFLMVGYGSLGDVLGGRPDENLGDVAGAAAAYEKAVQIAESLAASDSVDRKAQFDLSSAYQRFASLLVNDPKTAKQALEGLEKARRINRALQVQDPDNYRYRFSALVIDREAGEALDNMGRSREAVERLEAARAVAQALISGPNGSAAKYERQVIELRLARIRARTKHGLTDSPC